MKGTYLNFNFSFVHVLQQQFQMLGVHILEENHRFHVAAQPFEQGAKVWRTNAEHKFVGRKEFLPGGQGNVGIFLTFTQFLRPGEKQGMVIVPFEQKVFTGPHFVFLTHCHRLMLVNFRIKRRDFHFTGLASRTPCLKQQQKAEL